MNPKIAAAYIRVSTDDQVEYSPESQVSKIQELAKREGYLIPEKYFFRDEGISGKNADKRPAFRLMIATAKQECPPFEVIYVWEFSRFARNQEESILYKNLLRKHGIIVRSVREPLSDSPFATLIERIIEWMDEYYLINLAVEVRRGMTEKARRGEAMGTAPYGYTCKNKTFYPNENAETVGYIFQSYANGTPIRKLATELAAAGIRTRRGNPPDYRWVAYILSNPVYIGKIRWSTQGRANYNRTAYSGDHVILVEGKHEPIIDTALWDAVQARLTNGKSEIKYVRQDTNRVFALKGCIRCGNCGATLTLLSRKIPSLQCHKYAKGQCQQSHYIHLERATDTVLDALEHMTTQWYFSFAPQPPRKQSMIHPWEHQITTERARLARAKDALLSGVFSPQEYAEIRDEIEKNINRLKQKQAAETNVALIATDEKMYCQKVLNVLDVINSPQTTDEQKNAALRSALEKIIYHKNPDHFEIHLMP